MVRMEKSRTNNQGSREVTNGGKHSIAEGLLPQVSVVLSVYDKPIEVLQTMKSVLQQRDVNLEFIIVLDGASYLVEQMLRVYAKDPRVRIVKQENRGLTRSLIRGCQLATYDYIARIDAGDTMDINRLVKQAKVLNRQKDIGIVASWVNMQTEEGYHLYKVSDDQETLSEGLKAKSTANFKTPIHASVMFRKSIYEQTGGYRKEFYVAQDADLWSRMIEISSLFVIPEVLTTGVFSASGISGRFAELQKAMARIIVEAIALRAAGKADKSALKKARALKPDKSSDKSSDGDYFIASILSKRASRYAKEYWWRVVKKQPLRLVAWPRLLVSLFYRGLE